ncbi:hypothetical protein KCU87_g1, partial [Aureobasidium melanogenum]
MTLCHVRNIGKHSLKKLDAQKRSTSKTSPSPSPSCVGCETLMTSAAPPLIGFSRNMSDDKPTSHEPSGSSC